MSQAVGIASQGQRDDISRYVDDYSCMVESVDNQMGRILDTLCTTAAAANTLIEFASNHSEASGARRWVQEAAF